MEASRADTQVPRVSWKVDRGALHVRQPQLVGYCADEQDVKTLPSPTHVLPIVGARFRDESYDPTLLPRTESRN